MTALPDWDIASDAELAAGAVAGDRAAFARIYDRYADRLHDFCIGMLRDRDAAADCVQDVFCIAATQLPELRDADKLRPWLYAIARNEALRTIRARRREQVSEEVPETASTEAGPDVMAARTELADLIAEAAGAMSDRDREVLELYYRHGLDGPELAEALGVSYSSAKKMAQRLREGIERSLGALLVSRRVMANPELCAELSAILEGWDGRFTILMRKRIARHIESCPTCDEERQRRVNPVALLGAVPVFIGAPAWLRERTLNQIQLSPATRTVAPADSGGDGGSGRVAGGGGRGLRLVVGAILIVSFMLGVGWLYQHQRSVSVTPSVRTADVTTTTAAPSGGQPREVPAVVPSTGTPVTTTVAPSTSTSSAAQPSSSTEPTQPSLPPPAAPTTAGGTANSPTHTTSAPTSSPVRQTTTAAPPSPSTSTSPSRPPTKITGIPPTRKPGPTTSAPVIQ